MTMELLKKTIEEMLKVYAKELLEDYDVRFETLVKNNCTKTGICFRKKGAGPCVSPTYHLDEVLEGAKYTEGKEELEEYLLSFIHRIKREVRKCEKEMQHLSRLPYEKMEENVFACLINKEANRDVLSKIPHRDFFDMAIVYRWLIEGVSGGLGTILVNEVVAKMAGLDEEALYQAALRNMPELMGNSIRNLAVLTRGLVPHNVEGYYSPLYVMTNHHKLYGASQVLLPECLDALAKEAGGDILIAMSSTDEVIAVRENLTTSYAFQQIVEDVNATEVEPEKRLSNNVFLYRMKERELSMATSSKSSIVAYHELRGEAVL